MRARPLLDGLLARRRVDACSRTGAYWPTGSASSSPQVNVVVLFVIAVTLIPVALAQRLTRDAGLLRTTAPRTA